MQNQLSELFPTSKNGYVYLIKNENTGFFKIGVTKNIKRRLRQLYLSSGCKLRLVFAVLYSDFDIPTIETEKILHSKYKDNRIIGEWFSITRKNIKEIEQYLTSIDFEDFITGANI